MTFELMDLPYDSGDLEPRMSRQTVEIHHGKHHRKYVDTLNELVGGTYLEKMTLEQVIFESAFEAQGPKIFNNAAQVWNHDLFWHSIAPDGGGDPTDEALRKRLEDGFGSIDEFKRRFTEAATGQFGSGWAWLVVDDGDLAIITTPNAVPPFVYGQHALLACDVWEHAYYLDFQNARGGFVESFLDKLVNWRTVAARLDGAGREWVGASKPYLDAAQRFVATGEIQRRSDAA